MDKYLAILEVSQKQAYIFSSNKLKENIRNSAIIEKVLSPKYILETLKKEGYSEENNMVYSGGGHTILEFESEDIATKFIRILTEKIYKEFDGLEVFAKLIKYNECDYDKDKYKSIAHKNIKNLLSELEKKKSIRRAAFHQGSYGIEKIDTNTLKRKKQSENEAVLKGVDNDIEDKEQKLFPVGFNLAKEFENLGGTKNESNFIAVVHIDGNGMGKRVEDFYEKLGEIPWNETKERLREFSKGIAEDFENAYKRMVDRVANAIESDNEVSKLNLTKNGHKYFPIRRVITAGDDVCFVTEGRIGIECARIFIEELTSKECMNSADGKGYSACAGVAIVHQKYPFYRAYELSEMLCSNAKRYGASISPIDNGQSISSIDWHVEFGELKDSLQDIREGYITNDGNRLYMRPYIVHAKQEVIEDKFYSARTYNYFKTILLGIASKENSYATGKIKNLRNVLREGELETQYYLEFNKMTDLVKGKSDIFVKQSDGSKSSMVFDAIELLDTFVSID